MSLKPEAIPEVPVDTERIAHAALPPDNLCLAIRDRIGMIYQDSQFQALFATRGQPAECPWRLALVCILQFAENLSDRQAANAVRARIDWKYLLSLSLEDTGFHYSVLSEFRSRLVNGEGEQVLFEALLDHLKTSGLLKARGQQRTDSTHVLAAIRALNRLGMCRGDPPPYPQQPRRGCSRLALGAQFCRLGRTLRTSGRGLSFACRRTKTGGVRGSHRRGWALAA